MKITHINYHMTADYCSDWDAIAGIREFAQNAIDQGRPIFNVDADEITITTKNAVLPRKVFALGVSQKRFTDSLGKYGEGFKIGMLVLTRLGLKPKILTGNLAVTGVFLKDEFTQVQTFHLVISELPQSVNKTVFSCKTDGLNLSDLIFRIPYFEEPLKEGVLQDECMSGHIFVGGLYVCSDDRLMYGYNFPVGNATLNRDRNTVCDLLWTVSENILKENNAELLYDMLMKKSADVTYFNHVLYQAGSEFKSALKAVHDKRTNKPIKNTTGVYDTTNRNVGVILEETAFLTLKECGVTTVDEVAPFDVKQALKDWYDEYVEGDVHEAARGEFDKLLEQL